MSTLPADDPGRALVDILSADNPVSAVLTPRTAPEPAVTIARPALTDPCADPECQNKGQDGHPYHWHGLDGACLAVLCLCQQFVPADRLAAQRDDLLAQARAKTPGVRITAEASADDADALRAEITALREFVDRPTPGLHTDTYDEDADGENVDPTNV